MAAIAVTVAEEVEKKAAEYLVAWVCRHCGYLIFSNRKVRQLKDELEKLDPASQRVQHRTEVARRNMRPIEADVEKWMGEVETVTTEARDLLQDHDGRGNTTCFYGWLPNPKARYRFGKEASRMVKDIPGLIERGQFPEVAFENPPRGLVMDGAPNLIILGGHHGGTIIESRASILEDIMNALDDEKLKVIGIYGPGGVGKTTLLGEVEEKLRKEKRLFHLIAPTKVSQTPDLKNIQNDIAFALGLNLKDEPSEVGRRDLLHRKLQSDLTEKVLIILDDLWTELDLKAVGIPSGDESGKCKLLLTSRYQDVLEEKMNANLTFRLDGLPEDEAFRLFEKIVGDKLKDEVLKAKAAQVVKKLAGLPLLIKSVASTLKCRNAHAWECALIKIENPEIKDIVGMSYEHLESADAKSLFLLCGLIGGTIQVELLLELGIGLSLFEGFNDTLQVSRNRLNTVLDSLRSICLLQDGGDDKEKVTIHDLYSEVVVSTQFRGQNSLMTNGKYGSWPKENLEKCWAISLTNAGGDRLAELTTCQFPELEILMLSLLGNRPWEPDRHDDWRHWMLEPHDDVVDCYKLLDFNYMKKLRVLRLRSTTFVTLPSSIEILENLQSLYLNDGYYLEDVAILGKLRALQILSFAGSPISKLPKEIGGLTKLRSLNLSCCCGLNIIERGALKGLINLEELYMRGSFDRWMGEDKEASESCNARLAELKSLTKLTALEISIRDPAVLLEDGDLPFGNLIRFWIEIGFVCGSTYERSGNMILNLSGIDSILSKEWVQKTLQRTQYLSLGGLSESKESAHELCNGGFSRLKHLFISNSTSIKYIALSAFPSLESLHLENLEYLEKICDARGEPECSGKLKYIEVEICHRLKNLWCLSNQQRLVHLEKIEVRKCDSMQAIITYDARNVGATAAADVIVELPNVRTLYLSDLPSMTSFCIEDNGGPIQVSFPRLESLSMFGLSNLKNLCHGPPESFSKLKVVSGTSCPQLKTLLNVSNKRLVHLKQIEVTECKSMQAIIIYDARNAGAIVADATVELPKVRILKLDMLPSITSLCIGADGAPIQLSLLCLESLSLNSLGSLQKFCIPGGLHKLKDMTISKCSSLESFVDCGSLDSNTEQVMSFSSLDNLCIESCPNFREFIRSPTNVERPSDEMIEEKDESAQPFFNEMVSFPNITKLYIKGIRCEELWSNQIPRDSFCKLLCFDLFGCGKLRHIAPSCMWMRLRCCLEILRVRSCHSIEVIYEGDETDTENSKLRALVMFDLDSLKHIWRSDGQPNVPFPNLRRVWAKRCSRLEILFASFTEKFLGQMKKLVVESCKNMKLIAGHEEWEGAISRTITFSNLSTLGLLKLPQFRSLLPEKYSPNFPSLRVLNRKGCGNEPDERHGNWGHYDVWSFCYFGDEDSSDEECDVVVRLLQHLENEKM